MPAVATPSSVSNITPTLAPKSREATAAIILVVEDDPILSEVLCRILSRDGHDVSRALNASEALEVIHKRVPQLVLLDACLREGTSLQLAKTIHRHNANLPLILLTNTASRKEDFQSWTAGRVLNKSLGLADLRWAVASALNEAKAPPAPRVLTSMVTLLPNHPSPDFGNGSALRTAKDFCMRLLESKSSKVIGAALLGVALLVGFVAANGASRPSTAAAEEKPAAAKNVGTGDKSAATDSIELVPGKLHTLYVPADIRTGLGIRKDNVDLFVEAKVPKRMRPLEMPGSTGGSIRRGCFASARTVCPLALIGRMRADRPDRRRSPKKRKNANCVSGDSFRRQGRQGGLAGRLLQRGRWEQKE